MLLQAGQQSLASLVVKLPCIWIALAAPRDRILAMIAGWNIYAVLVTALEFGILMSVLGGPGSELGEIFAAVLLGHEVMGLVVTVVLLALRGLGYRLLRTSRT